MRAQLISRQSGRIVAAGQRRRVRAQQTPVHLRPRAPLGHGRHVLLVSGRNGDGLRRIYSDGLDFDSRERQPPGPGFPTAALRLDELDDDVGHPMIDWRNEWRGHGRVTFAALGIGSGVIACTPDTQWLRFFPDDLGRETAMMTWTFKDLGGHREHAVREAEKSRFSEPDFNEGLNKFGPTPEHRSRGFFVGVISDRLPVDAGGGRGESPVVFRLNWSWDLSDPNSSSCFATGAFVRPSGGVGPLSVNWRGDANGDEHGLDAAQVPGAGRVAVRCEPRPGGTRRLIVTPDGDRGEWRFSVYEGSEEWEAAGDATSIALPNNGLVAATHSGGGALLLSSRWKVNDPDPGANFCHVAGLAGG